MAIIGGAHHRAIYYPIPNFAYSQALWEKAAADRAHVFALPLIATVALFELVIKNPVMILANCAIRLLDAADPLIRKIYTLFRAVMAHPVNRAFHHLLRSLSRIFRRESNRPAPALYRPAINTIPPLPGQQFSEAELSAFKVALQTLEAKNEISHVKPKDDSTIYAFWCDSKANAIHIHIQNATDQYKRNTNNLITAVIDEENRITSITTDEGQFEQIPDELLPLFRACFLESLKFSSNYTDVYIQGTLYIGIEVIPRSLKEIPDFHLDTLTTMAVRNPDLRVRVNFLHSIEVSHQGGFASDGTDAGGPSREYMDTLAESLTVRQLALLPNQRLLDYWEDPVLHLLLPCAKEGALLTVPDLTFEEEKMFRQMGQMIQYCSRHSLLIGKRFHPGLFRAAFSLTDAELNRKFAQLTHETKLKMAEQIARANEEPAASIRLITLAQKGDAMTPEELREAEEFLNNDGNLPPNFDPANEAKKKIILEALRDRVYEKEGVGKSLAAIHAIAKGMKQMHDLLENLKPRRQPFQNINPEQFDRKVQGSINRDTVAAALEEPCLLPLPPGVSQKVTWLREWLRNEATDEEVYAFLKWATGSSSLPENRQIRVRLGATDALPVAHTCPPPTIDIGNGRETKGTFIGQLKEWCLRNPEGYQMV